MVTTEEKLHFSIFLSDSFRQSPHTDASFHFRVNCSAVLCTLDIYFSYFCEFCLSQLYKMEDTYSMFDVKIVISRKEYLC